MLFVWAGRLLGKFEEKKLPCAISSCDILSGLGTFCWDLHGKMCNSSNLVSFGGSESLERSKERYSTSLSLKFSRSSEIVAGT